MSNSKKEVGVIILSKDGVVKECDPTAARLLSISATHSPGQKITALFPETRALEVLLTGKSLWAFHRLREHTIECIYLPSKREGTIEEVLIIVKTGEEKEKLIREKDFLHQILDLYEHVLSDLKIGLAVVNPEGRVITL